MGRERREGDCTHEPELHAWLSSCAAQANGDPSRERKRDGAVGRDESRGWFTGKRLALGKLIPKHKSHWPPLLFLPKNV